MGLDFSKLENVRYHGTKAIARCPACAEAGNDRKGEHLFIEQNGRFGCVVFSGHDGHKHRQRIFELIGIKTGVPSGFKIKKPLPLFQNKKSFKRIFWDAWDTSIQLTPDWGLTNLFFKKKNRMNL